MAKIPLANFAEHCVGIAMTAGALPEYVVAVAQVRSGIDDAVAGNETGPFRLTQEQWNANRQDPDGVMDLDPDDIKDWPSQCFVFSRMTAAAQTALHQTLGRNFSIVELYLAQWPGAGTPAKLTQDFSAALQTITQAVKDARDKLHAQQAPIVNDPTQQTIGAGS